MKFQCVIVMVLLCFIMGIEGKWKKRCRFNYKRYYFGTVVRTYFDGCVELKCVIGTNPKNAQLEFRLSADCECPGAPISERNLVRNSTQDMRELENHKITKSIAVYEPVKIKENSPKRCYFNKMRLGLGETVSMEDLCMTLTCVKPKKRAYLRITKTACKCNKLPPTSITATFDDRDISPIVDAMNAIRSAVALGIFSTVSSDYFPTASKMNELSWSTDLANEAQAWAEGSARARNCVGCRWVVGDPMSQLVHTTEENNDDNIAMDVVVGWSIEGRLLNPSYISSYVDDPAFKQFSQFVWGDTYLIGCGKVHYNPCKVNGVEYTSCKVHACNFGPEGNIVGQAVYQTGDPMTNCVNGVASTFPGLCLP